MKIWIGNKYVVTKELKVGRGVHKTCGLSELLGCFHCAISFRIAASPQQRMALILTVLFSFLFHCRIRCKNVFEKTVGF